MKSLMATLTVAVLVGAQPLSGQIGQEVSPPAGVVTPPPPARPQQPAPARPQQMETRTQERTHVVRRGDTLWDLANQYYSNPYAWPTIHDANRRVVEDPHWIYPEEVLVIPGAPTAVAEGPPSDPGRITPVGLPEMPTTQQPQVDPNRRTRFYRSGEMQEDIFIDAEVTRVVVGPGEHYAAPWVANPESLPVLGVVLRTTDAPPGDSEQDLMVHPFDEVYVEYRGSTRPPVGERLIVVDVFREFDDGRDEFVIRPAGIMTVVETDADVMIAQVTEHWAPFNRGARVLSLPRFEAVTGEPEVMRDGAVGRVRGFMLDQPLYATTDYGFLDLNQSQTQVGDVVMIYRESRDGDTVLPPEPIAFGTIVRVGPEGSTFRATKVMQRRLGPGLPALIVGRVP